MNSDQLTRAYFDRITLKTRLIGSDLPDMKMTLWGETFNYPIATAALSHQKYKDQSGMGEMACATIQAGVPCFIGLTDEPTLKEVADTGARFISITKPDADQNKAIERIQDAVRQNAFAVGVDIDHAYGDHGEYDNVLGIPCRPKTVSELRELVEAAEGLPFVVKGVLSPEDALASLEAGASGIILSHHHDILKSAVPPLRILPEIRKAVGDRMKIFVDCCFDNGTDAFKALALGADAVCIGRALMDSIKSEGREGCARELLRIAGELKSAMARCGYKDVASIDDSCIYML